jgi:SAM-dependent MidA family methyltransferase
MLLADVTSERAATAGHGSTAGYLGIAGLDELGDASSLLSSRWSRDNLVTAHPARLYDGRVVERIGPDTLEYLVQEVGAERGPFEVGAGRMGVVTWDMTCRDAAGAFVLQLPVALDEVGPHRRAKRDVPAANFDNARYFRERGLGRFVLEPERALTLAGGVPAAIFRGLPGHRALTFGGGAVRVRHPDGWVASLGPRGTAELLAEMVAVLVYHYEPELERGTALTDVFVNDGDFVARRRSDGTFDLRLTAARRREPGVAPNLLLLYLLQLMAYEDWSVDGALTGLPVLVSNPSVAFEGVVRGLRYRYRDLGAQEAEAERDARAWIANFARAAEGRAYRPWAERFLDGRLPLRFGADPREHWWRLYPLERRQRLLELHAKAEPASTAAASARALRSFIDRLRREIGRSPADAPELVRINELDRDGMLALLEEANVEAPARERVGAEIFAQWPERSLDRLLGLVPAARGLRRLKSRLSFGFVVAADEEGTLKSLEPRGKTSGPERALANHELFAPLALPPSLAAEAAGTFPTFEAYMDAALHDPAWGYYGHAVVIGKAGHFDTHPEELSPDYGRWVAACAFGAWRELLAQGELSQDDPFPVIEFGAGNGRLARDVLDAVAQPNDELRAADSAAFATFAARLEYRIYETSESLRARQRELVGARALIGAGDARSPRATLERDFPNGLRGFVVSNELPDAFGVHKVVLAADGRAFAALVVPLAEPDLDAHVGTELAGRIAHVDASLRKTFGLAPEAAGRYLDAATFGAVMRALAGLAPAARERALACLWFREAYVPAAALPALAAHLAQNARQYATALAAEASGVVAYVNLHASRFIVEVAAVLRAGFVVTVDYGNSTWELVQAARRGEFPFRVYGDQRADVPRPNDPYAAPGTQDMTADVNFTDLANAGEAAGLKLVHYGPERDLAGAELPALLRAAAGDDRLAKFLGHPGFQVLALATRESALFSTPLTTPLPLLAREHDVPKSGRHRIAELERRWREAR